VKSNRNAATIVGLLLLVAWFAGVAGRVLGASILDDPNRLARIAGNEFQLTTAALLELLMAIACPAIAIALYPVLRKHNEGLALASVGLRLIEGMAYVVSVAALLLLLTLRDRFVQAGSSDASFFQETGALLVAGRHWLGTVAGIITFGLGATMYYLVMFRARLVPRWLSGWGLVAVAMTVVAGVLTLFGAIGFMSTSTVLLNMPIALQELVLAVWLIARGFNPRAIAATAMEPSLARAGAL
jgi:hypothetical protein